MSAQFEVRVDGERHFRTDDLPLAREMFWLLVNDSPGCAVELMGPDEDVLDFVEEDHAESGRLKHANH